jgi:hypothetical protein
MTPDTQRTKFEVQIRVQVRTLNEHGGWNGQGLETAETMVMELGGFTEIAAVLGRFHDLAQAIHGDGPRAAR